MRAGDPHAAQRVILIHGFGASSRHWRSTMPALGSDTEVLALDLLGFGESDKPRSRLADEATASGFRYCFDHWAEQVIDLIGTVAAPTRQRLHLVGNSIGGMVALTAACALRDAGQPPHQVILIDCAQRALDDKRLGEQPLLAQLTRPSLKHLVRQRWITNALFRLLARPAVIRQVLRQAYPTGAHVNDELVELLYQPTQSAGANESFRGFINLFADHLAPTLLARLSATTATATPGVVVRMLWGLADPWEDPRVAEQWAATYACVKELTLLPDLGHCPHDEAPELVNPILRAWILAD